MCAPGLCADGYAFFAVVQTHTGQKSIRLDATTLTEAECEAIAKKSPEAILLYIESRRVATP